MSEIGLNTTVVRSDEVLASPMGQEVVMIDLESGAYFGLNPIGADLWQRLEKPRRVSDLCAELVREYEVEPEVCTRDVLAWLEKLEAEGLLETAGEG